MKTSAYCFLKCKFVTDEMLLLSCCSYEIQCCRSISKVHDAWFADEDAVRKSVGLLDKQVVQLSNAREVSALVI